MNIEIIALLTSNSLIHRTMRDGLLSPTSGASRISVKRLLFLFTSHV